MKKTPLKRYTPLLAKTGFKRSATSLKRSSIKRKKELTPQQTLDSIVSKVIRLESSDTNGMVQCVTCKRYFNWQIIQCGHFQRRGNLSTRYEQKNLGPQCEECNCYNDGENELFALFIDEFHGEGTAEKIRHQARQMVFDFPYQEEIIKWSERLQKLLVERNSIINY